MISLILKVFKKNTKKKKMEEKNEMKDLEIESKQVESKCPFDHRNMKENKENKENIERKCPVDQKMRENEGKEEIEDNKGNVMTECPYGFSKKASIPYFCRLCYSIYFDPVELVPCGHQFCRECCKDGEYCEVDGWKINSKTESSKLKEEVEFYINSHSSNHIIKEDLSFEKIEYKEEEKLYNQALFLFSISLRSFHGKNFKAAASRGEKSKQSFQSFLSEKENRTFKNVLEISTIIAKIGDFQSKIEKGQVIKTYQESLEILEEFIKTNQLTKEENDSLEENINIILLKKGDFFLMNSQKKEALEIYQKVLEKREEMKKQKESFDSLVNLAVSLGKVADLELHLFAQKSSSLNKFQEALNYCNQASEIEKKKEEEGKKINPLLLFFQNKIKILSN